jgi:Na+/H+ antiporter NhaA
MAVFSFRRRRDPDVDSDESRDLSGRTAWARSLAAPVREFLSTETSGGAALVAAVLCALLWANLPGWHSYESVWHTNLSLQLGGASVAADLRTWVDQGLMTLFFLVVGLEARRELETGELRERDRLLVPAAAAACGMLFPVLIFLAFNAGGHGAGGWGAAMSSDTAFALAALSLVTPRSATRLRVFLVTTSVFDDLGGLAVITVVYSHQIKALALLIALLLFVAFLLLPRILPVPRAVRVLLGVGVWLAMFKSGVDPVISGLALGLAVTAGAPSRQVLEQVSEITRAFREQPTPELASAARQGVGQAVPPNERLQYALHPWTSYVIVPLFALANAGVHLGGGLLGTAFTSPITIGIALAYLLGKPLGVLAGALLVSRPRFHGPRLPVSWPVLAGGGAVMGIGFTVSILIASLAFTGVDLEEAKIGVLITIVLAPIISKLVLVTWRRLPDSVRARQLANTSAALVDLSEEIDPERDHIRGAEQALVTLVEYGDFECPFCGRAEPAIRELLERWGDGLRYVWRHLPLQDVHPTAQIAAQASEAAAQQGRFWEMHDLLLAHTSFFTEADLEGYARQLELDIERFWQDLRSGTAVRRVSRDVCSADSSDVTGTPTFFINDRRHYGAYDVDTLSEAVQSARGRANLLAVAGEQVSSG